MRGAGCEGTGAEGTGREGTALRGAGCEGEVENWGEAEGPRRCPGVWPGVCGAGGGSLSPVSGSPLGPDLPPVRAAAGSVGPCEGLAAWWCLETACSNLGAAICSLFKHTHLSFLLLPASCVPLCCCGFVARCELVAGGPSA